MKKNNKKKLLIIFLFLFALAGTIGYGVYSYYYTEGSFETNSDTINISSFNPVAGSGSYAGSFLGNGGSGESVTKLECPEYAGGRETVECTATLDVKNDGDTTFSLDVDNIEVVDELSNNDSNNSVNYSIGSPSPSWSSSTVSAGESSTLTITVPVTFDNNANYSAESSEAEYVSSPVAGGKLSLTVSYRVTATQEH